MFVVHKNFLFICTDCQSIVVLKLEEDEYDDYFESQITFECDCKKGTFVPLRN